MVVRICESKRDKQNEREKKNVDRSHAGIAITQVATNPKERGGFLG